jgi:glycosyltransferase involved in cell wall biosynthesis
MDIAINTQLLNGKLEGIGRFQYELLKRLVPKYTNHHFYFIFDKPWQDRFIFSSNITPICTPVPNKHPLLWYLRFHHLIPGILRKHNIKLFVSPDGYNVPAGITSYNVIHDLNFVHHPENMPPVRRAYYRHFFPQYARNATRLATVSEYSKKDMADTWHIPPDNIDVIYNAASESFKPLTNAEKRLVKEKYTQGADYFVFVGALNPRKNIIRMLEAFDHFCEKNMGRQQIKLLIVGTPMYSGGFYSATLKQMKHQDKVVFTGHKQQHELGSLIGGAMALLLPSTFEGFGIPLVEAMHCEVPLITSKVTAMPEVAGDAALFADPHNTDSISQAMITLVNDQALQKTLITNGRIQRQRFSWDKSAEKFWTGIEFCINQGT